MFFFIIFFSTYKSPIKEFFFKSLIDIIERREQQRSNRARRAKDNSRIGGEENKLQTNLRPREDNNLQSQESTNQPTTELNNAQIDPWKENEEKRPRMDFSNILNSTAIEGGNSLEQFQKMQLPPMTSAASASPSPIREKVKVAQSPEIEFLEAREVECPDCDKKFAARAKLLAHLVSAHYSEKIFKIHPFQKNAPCPLCINSGKQFAIPRTTECVSPCFIFKCFSQYCDRATESVPDQGPRQPPAAHRPVARGGAEGGEGRGDRHRRHVQQGHQAQEQDADHRRPVSRWLDNDDGG